MGVVWEWTGNGSGLGMRVDWEWKWAGNGRDVQDCQQRLTSAFDLPLIFLCSLIQTLTLTPPPNNALLAILDMYGEGMDWEWEWSGNGLGMEVDWEWE